MECAGFDFFFPPPLSFSPPPSSIKKKYKVELQLCFGLLLQASQSNYLEMFCF